MADIKTITLPSGSTYNIVDQGARDLIASLNNLGWTLSTNASTTPKGVVWTPKGQSTSVTGTLEASASTANTQYLVYKGDSGKDSYDEYITVKTGSTTYQWERLGSTDVQLGDLGKLAFVDSASGSYSYKYPNKMTGSHTSAGTVSQPTFTGDSLTSTGTFTATGSVSQPTFTGNSLTSTGTFTPSGSNAKSAVTISPTTTDVYSMSSAGSVTAGSSASCTLPSLTTTVSNGNLTIGWSAGSFTANTPTAVTLPSRSTAIKAWTGYNTGVANTYASAQAFTGTANQSISVSGTPTGTVSKPTFTGTASQSISVSGTPTGTVSQPTFTGSSRTVTVTSTAVTTDYTTETGTVTVAPALSE